MSNNLRFDFEVNKKTNGVSVVREFAAPPDRVWAAWTTAALLDQWWAPEPYKAKTKELELRPGGRWLYAMVGPEGDEQWCRAIYSTVTPQTGYSYDDAFSDAEGNVTNEFPGSHWDVRFELAGDRTTVFIDISHKSAEDLERILGMGFREGFAAGLGNLDKLLANEG